MGLVGVANWQHVDDLSRFDQAVDQARQEGNLSRANVVRKIRGEDTPDDPDPMDRKGEAGGVRRPFSTSCVILVS